MALHKVSIVAALGGKLFDFLDFVKFAAPKTMVAIYKTPILLIVFAISQLAGQDEKALPSDSISFERIILDGRTAFLNSSTKEILSERDYNHLRKELDSHYVAPIATDFWDTLQVNPYKDIKIKRPFRLDFPDRSYQPPVDHKMYITSRFGRRRRGPHRGIDIDLEVGDPVRTILSGQVRFVGYSRGHGKTVIVRHENDIETVYAHLSEYSVRTNDFVEKGQTLGLGGASGNARGSHLHMEIRHKGICINPEYLLDFEDPKIYADSMWVTKSLIDPLSHSSYRKGRYEILTSLDLAKGYDKRARKVHVVRRGDTLWGIARSNGMRVSDLVKMNKSSVSTKSTLRIGQHLVISP